MGLTHRQRQTERGLEAVQSLAKFLESKNGPLTVSIHESHFSSGSHAQPDLVFGAYGIEVKRVEMFTRHHFPKKESYYAHLGHASLLHESWDGLKEWCKRNFKVPLLVVVLTWGRQAPIFVKLSQGQIDELQVQQAEKRWIQLNSWDVLLKGEIWK